MFASHLRRLAFHLRNNVRDEVFNLATWVGNDDVPWEGKDDLSCGTSACAMGWATTIPEFKEMGLRLEQTTRNGQGFIAFGEFKHFEAAAKFMDITLKEAEYLFNPDQYPDDEDTSRLQVCDRIENFVDNGGIPEEDEYLEDEDDDQFDEGDDEDLD